jgi:DNA-binding response OmpR family regulator
VLEVGLLRVDTAARRASVDGAEMALTAKEFDLLTFLARTPGRVLTHGALVAHVWGVGAPPRLDSLRVHVAALRRKIGAGPGVPAVRSEPGVGYRLALV